MLVAPRQHEHRPRILERIVRRLGAALEDIPEMAQSVVRRRVGLYEQTKVAGGGACIRLFLFPGDSDPEHHAVHAALDVLVGVAVLVHRRERSGVQTMDIVSPKSIGSVTAMRRCSGA